MGKISYVWMRSTTRQNDGHRWKFCRGIFYRMLFPNLHLKIVCFNFIFRFIDLIYNSILSGWFARDPITLTRVGQVLLPSSNTTGIPTQFVIPGDCFKYLGSPSDKVSQILKNSVEKIFGCEFLPHKIIFNTHHQIKFVLLSLCFSNNYYKLLQLVYLMM